MQPRAYSPSFQQPGIDRDRLGKGYRPREGGEEIITRIGGTVSYRPNKPLPSEIIVTGKIVGDPEPGRSALDQRRRTNRELN